MGAWRFSKGLIVAMFVSVALFIIAVFVVFWHTSCEPSTLIVSFFGFVGLEGGAMAWIRTSKEKTRRLQNEDKLETKIVE